MIKTNKQQLNITSLLGMMILILSLFGASVLPFAANAEEDSKAPASNQALIEMLMAKIADLQAKIADLASGSSSGSDNSSQSESDEADLFTRDLVVGSKGEDVRKLQRFLNRDPETRVTDSGEGSVGKETNYFGPATAAALKRFQEKHKAEILKPHDLSKGTGFFGGFTRDKIKEILKKEKKADSDSDDSDTDTERGHGYIKDKNANAPKIKTSCHSGDKSYDEGGVLKLNFRSNTADPLNFVCRDGRWTMERSGSSDPVKSIKTCTNYTDGKSEEYSEGKKLRVLTDDTGKTRSISDASFVCRSGEWKIEGSYPEENKDVDDSKNNSTDDVSTVVSGNTVSVSFMSPNTCGAYKISWGDRLSSSKSSDDMICGQAFTKVTVSHTYAKAGTYTIKISNGNKQQIRVVEIVGSSPTSPSNGYVRGASTVDANEVLSQVIQRVVAIMSN